MNQTENPAVAERSQPRGTAACPLCNEGNAHEFFRDKRRNYLRCQACNLIFVPSSQFLSEADEKSRYDFHQNSPEDLKYCRFLSRMFIRLAPHLTPGSCGLDFGCGPEPLLSKMFEEAGYPMTTFDYFYKNVPSALSKQYDFITATEVVEHLHDPGKDLHRLWACLKPGGRLGIMTKFAVDHENFSQWYYKNDRTHVCFFSRPTFTWLAVRWNADLTFHENDVVLFRKIAPLARSSKQVESSYFTIPAKSVSQWS